MVRNLLLATLVCFSLQCFSQDSKINLELSYPLPIDNNFIGENYNGIIDIGTKFRFASLNIINIGGSINAGYLKNSKDNRVQPIDVNLYTIQPRIFAELNLETLEKFHPSLGFGYSIFLFKPQPSNGIGNNADETIDESGFNLNLGIAYDISDSIMLLAQYDFVKIDVRENVPDITYNSNVNLIKVGLGYRF